MNITIPMPNGATFIPLGISQSFLVTFILLLLPNIIFLIVSLSAVGRNKGAVLMGFVASFFTIIILAILGTALGWF